MGILVFVVVVLWTGCGGDEEVIEQVIVTGPISGVVVDQTTQQGIAGAEVRLNNGLSTLTGPDGSFRFEDVKSDTYTLSVSARGYLKQEQRVKVTNKGAIANIRMQPGVSVSGIVTSDDGNLVSQVRVTLGERASVTDSGGRYEISPVAKGQYNLVAEKPGYETTSLQNIVVGDTEVKQDITIKRNLKGKILFARAHVVDKNFFGFSVVDANGTRVTPLTNLFDEQPTWSPDGARIIFSRSEN
ncbi:DUF2012 domain-containing protein, partial [Candidatus Poribacteria bacterium]|nr:DUF2012 domain-containing protein [Candidatus Poribacteria bacterium]